MNGPPDRMLMVFFIGFAAGWSALGLITIAAFCPGLGDTKRDPNYSTNLDKPVLPDE